MPRGFGPGETQPKINKLHPNLEEAAPHVAIPCELDESPFGVPNEFAAVVFVSPAVGWAGGVMMLLMRVAFLDMTVLGPSTHTRPANDETRKKPNEKATVAWAELVDVLLQDLAIAEVHQSNQVDAHNHHLKNRTRADSRARM